MKRWLKINYQNTVTKFMISYSLVLLLPLVIFMIGFKISFNIVEEGIKDTNLAMINQSKDTIDNEFSSLNTIVMQISINDRINTLTETSTQDKLGLYYDVKEAIKLLSDLSMHSTVSVIERLYVYLRDTDYIVTPDTLYKSDFYYTYILQNHMPPFQDWKDGLFDDFNHRKYVIHNDEIDYIQSIPFTYNTDPKGVVVVTVKKDKLAKFFSRLEENSSKGAFMYIQDKEGNIITSVSDNNIPGYVDFTNIKNSEGFFRQKINEQNMIVIHTVSNVNGWKYVLVLPENVVMGKLISFQKTIITLFLIALLSGIVISYYLAYINGKPLNRIIQELKDFIVEDSTLGNNLEVLGGTVSTLITNNRALTSELEKQQPLVQAAFLQKLIKGEFATQNEMQVFSENAGVNIGFKKMVVVAFRIFIHNDKTNIDRDTLKELSIAHIVTKDILKKYMKGQVYFHDIDHLTSVCIIGVDTLFHIEQQLQNILELSTIEIIQEHKIKPYFGIGSECANLLELWRSYEGSKAALNYAIRNETVNIMWHHNIKEQKVKYYYPLDFEKRLINYTKEGDYKNIDNLLEILYVENFQKRFLQSHTIDKLYNEIISTVIKLTQPHTDSNLIEKLSSFVGKTNQREANEFFKEVREIYSEISTQFNQDKTSRHLKMIHGIKEYINRIYTDSALGLSMVASEFNISEGYLSFFFKEQTGINFTDYVEKLRIDKACELLLDNSLTIKEISGLVGYNSVQSFRRAFKRIQGVSPSEMRKSK